MNKWKVAFFISMTFSILTIIGAGYIVLTNTILSGNNHDRLQTITMDIENISKAIQNNASTIDEFDIELEKNNSGHSTDKEYNIIRLEIAAIIFDNKGRFVKIETYQ